MTIVTACPACGGSKFSNLPEPGRWIGMECFGPLRSRIALVRCRGCGSCLVNPRPSHAALMRFYSGDTYTCHDSDGSASDGKKAQFLLDQIESTASSHGAPRTLLDFGCGGGAFLRHASKRGWESRGFEPGRRGYETCLRSKVSVVANLNELPRNYFGMITLHHVFEHLEDHEDILNSLRGLLAPRGSIFIEVPNIRSLRAKLSAPLLSRRFGFDERYRAFPIHLTYFHARSLTLLLRRAGWSIDRLFTAGLGVEELIFSPDVPSTAVASSAAPSIRSSNGTRTQIARNVVKAMVFGAGLGENLCAFSRPLVSTGKSLQP